MRRGGGCGELCGLHAGALHATNSVPSLVPVSGGSFSEAGVQEAEDEKTLRDPVVASSTFVLRFCSCSASTAGGSTPADKRCSLSLAERTNGQLSRRLKESSCLAEPKSGCAAHMDFQPVAIIMSHHMTDAGWAQTSVHLPFLDCSGFQVGVSQWPRAPHASALAFTGLTFGFPRQGNVEVRGHRPCNPRCCCGGASCCEWLQRAPGVDGNRPWYNVSWVVGGGPKQGSSFLNPANSVHCQLLCRRVYNKRRDPHCSPRFGSNDASFRCSCCGRQICCRERGAHIRG